MVSAVGQDFQPNEYKRIQVNVICIYSPLDGLRLMGGHGQLIIEFARQNATNLNFIVWLHLPVILVVECRANCAYVRAGRENWAVEPIKRFVAPTSEKIG